MSEKVGVSESVSRWVLVPCTKFYVFEGRDCFRRRGKQPFVFPHVVVSVCLVVWVRKLVSRGARRTGERGCVVEFQ